jgi:hypothetical protein
MPKEFKPYRKKELNGLSCNSGYKNLSRKNYCSLCVIFAAWRFSEKFILSKLSRCRFLVIGFFSTKEFKKLLHGKGAK